MPANGTFVEEGFEVKRSRVLKKIIENVIWGVAITGNTKVTKGSPFTPEHVSIKLHM